MANGDFTSLEIGDSGVFVLIDLQDVELFNRFRWTSSSRYVHVKGRPTLRLHRMLVDAPDGVLVDHINGDPLDNRRSNLRTCSHSENMKNRKVHKNNSLGVKGVYYEQRPDRKPRYVAQIRVDGKKIVVGRFTSLEVAEAAYKTAAQKYHGEFSRSE